MRLVEHEPQQLGRGARLVGRGDGCSVLERRALLALFGPLLVGLCHLGGLHAVLGRQAGGREVRAHGGERGDAVGMIAGEEQPLDGAVGEAKHVSSADLERIEDEERILGHELVGETVASARAFSLRSRVDRHDGATRPHHRVDRASEDAMLLAVAVEHEHGCGQKGPLGVDGRVLGTVDKRCDERAVRHGDVGAKG